MAQYYRSDEYQATREHLPCRAKIWYENRGKAKAGAVRINRRYYGGARAIEPYICEYCSGYHLGHARRWWTAARERDERSRLKREGEGLP